MLAPAVEHQNDIVGAVMARSTAVGAYVATTQIDTRGMKRGALAGLSAYGDGENALGIAFGDGKIILWRREKNHQQTITTVGAPSAPLLSLRMMAKDGHRFRFAWSHNGRDWQDVGDEIDGSYLPPWDRGVRVALTAGGAVGAAGKFAYLRMVPSR